MHKIYFTIYTEEQWYTVIRECKRWFGDNWKGQRGVRKKLNRYPLNDPFADRHKVWFMVPDPAFKTFMDLKMDTRQVIFC